ncbi:UvrD-helicase domain-containing protein [Methylovulum psychrotolerans]|nr:UvrD-helicase domain-containing protein [Methylovulum psychrotolerans]
MMGHITFISAGAGSGKTYRLAGDLEKILTTEPAAKPSGIIGTTFTKLAARELRERVRQRLNGRGFTQIANQMDQAMLGTVNSVCGQLLGRFAFEAGLSPNLKVIEEAEAGHLFSLALEQVLPVQTVQDMNGLAYRLGQDDWKSTVKAIVNTARANDQPIGRIEDSGKSSADALLAFFPEPTAKTLDSALSDAVAAAITYIKNSEDSTKGTKEYLALLQDVADPIKQHNLTWANWVKLSKSAATKKSQPASDAVQRAAADFERHPRLHADIRRYCEQLFNIAAAALAEFQAFKKVRGLIDFTDQEHLLYQALDNPLVQEMLQDGLEVLMVDEFQDTSPIQLALFLRLAQLAKQVIWVGDVKQAIYRFRGSDPDLMQAILQHLEANGGKTEVLETSWRSRTELVNYVNEVFVPAFANSLPQGRVALKPKPGDEQRPQAAVEHWRLAGGNQAKRALALAKGLQEFIADGYRLKDKDDGQFRMAHYGDVAVLSLTHSNLAQIADALLAFGIPVSRSQTGLLDTPEAALVLAAMRYLVDPSDSLATAEIICLSQGDAPEIWLQSRLDYMACEDKQSRWGDDIALLAALAKQRGRIQYLTPSELMGQAIHSADIRRVILNWQTDAGRAGQRLANIGQLLGFAESYESQCGNEGRAATVTGLLLWLDQLSKGHEDTQAGNTQTHAVQLLTHHGAKGLEWPIVIALDLDTPIKSNVWGLSVTADHDNLDITRPLQGRSLQYWLWPFGQQAKGIAVKERVEQSGHGLSEQFRAQEEAKRLLYVSLTRPRDCLILPLKDTHGEWLRVLAADWMLPDDPRDNGLTLPISKEKIPATFKTLLQEEAPETARTQQHDPHWFANLTSTQIHLPAKLSPSAAAPLKNAAIGEVLTLGDRVSLQGSPNMARLGEAVHALIATQMLNNPADPTMLAEQVLESYAVMGHISVGDALLCVARFRHFIEQRLNAKSVQIECPIEYRLPNGQTASGWIDALAETRQGYVIIDHKANPQSKADWHEVALKYSGQLALYKSAVEAATDKPVVGCWVHFALTGGCLKIDF